MIRQCTFVPLIALAAVGVATAQQPSHNHLRPGSQVAAYRLTVRPHAMTIGTRTSAAGVQTLPGFPGYLLYVPSQNVGTTRSPLLVLLHGGDRSAQMELEKFRPLADKYGITLLLPNAEHPGVWEMNEAGVNATVTETGLQPPPHAPMHDMQLIDSSMKLVLQQNAIDPDRIALLGFSDGGCATYLLGRNNQDIFSRVIPLSGFGAYTGGPDNPKTQFFLSGGIAEGLIAQPLWIARGLRELGHPVVSLVGLRSHVDYPEDEDFIWQWLVKSWADPGITAHPPVPADSDPVLTVEAMQKMTDFWTRFRQESDAVLDGRMAHQEQRWMMLGDQPASVIMTDIVALAGVYPSVAADLQAAGLTAHQEQAYRVALLRVGFTRAALITNPPPVPADSADGPVTGRHLPPLAPVAPSSVLGQNLAFRATHDDVFAALGKTGMWTTQ